MARIPFNSGKARNPYAPPVADARKGALSATRLLSRNPRNRRRLAAPRATAADVRPGTAVLHLMGFETLVLCDILTQFWLNESRFALPPAAKDLRTGGDVSGCFFSGGNGVALGIKGDREVIQKDSVHQVVKENDDARVRAKAPDLVEFEVVAQALT